MTFWNTQHLVLFNLAMLPVDVGFIWAIRRWPSLKGWLFSGFVALIVSALVVAHFSRQPGNITLTGSFFLFGHLTSWFLASAFFLRRTDRILALGSSAIALFLIVVGIDAFVIEPAALEVKHYRIADPRITRPIRLVVLADLQTDQIGPYERRVFERIEAEKPDLLLLAGDYFQCRARDWKGLRDQFADWLQEMVPKVPEGIYAVKGNLEVYYPWKPLFKDLPIEASNFTNTFQTAGIDLTCLSMRDSFRLNTVVKRPDPDRFHVVLGHSPTYVRGGIDADLMLAGHTHGGQIRVPWFRTPWLVPIITNSHVPREWAAGMTELLDGGRLVVSRGVGMERGNHARVRFLCRPELTVIDLIPAEEKLPETENRDKSHD